MLIMNPLAMNHCLPPDEPNTLHANSSKLQALLHKAIQNRNIPLVHKRLAQGASPSAAHGPSSFTPLMGAADACSPEIIEILLPLSDVDAANADGITALHIFMSAINLSRNNALFAPDDASLLDSRLFAILRSLASPAAIGAKDRLNRSPLIIHAARFLRGSPLFNIIASEIMPPSTAPSFALDIYEACAAALESRSSGSAGAIFLLNSTPNKTCALAEHPPNKSSLFHIAALHGRLDFLEDAAPLVDINARDSLGRTPLMAAISNPLSSSTFSSDNAIICMKRLLSLGADPRLVDNDGCDALMIAIEDNFRPLTLAPFLAHAFDPLISQSDLSRCDHLGESALDKAMDRNLPLVAALIQEKGGQPSPLPSHLYPPASGAKLQRLLLQAVAFMDTATVDKRLAQGADPLARLEQPILSFSPSLTTALMHAARDDNRSMICRLLPISDPLAVNAEGDTALMIFLIHNQIDSDDRLATLAALLSAESAKKRNTQGRTPLMAIRAPLAFLQPAIDLIGPLSEWNATDNAGANILGCHQLGHAEWLLLWNSHPDPAWLANAKDHEGRSFLHVIARWHRLDPQLFEAVSFHANFNVIDHSMLTPLMTACAGVSCRDAAFNAVIELLAARTNCQLADLNGCDALMLLIEAAANDQDSLLAARLLIPRSDLFARDFLGESALDKARDRSLLSIAAAIEAHMAIFAERDQLSLASSPTASTACKTNASFDSHAARLPKHRI